MRRLALLVAVAVGGAQLAALTLVVRNAPALNADIRRETVIGDWRIAPGADLFDRASYDFRIGYDYLQGDAYAITTSEGEVASDEVAALYTQRAVEALSASVNEGPADARAWMALAWALFDAGDTDAARRAVEVSWDLAPYNRLMAFERLLFAELVAQDLGIEMVPEWTDAVVADLTVAQSEDRRQFDAMLLISERMFDISDRAGLLDDPEAEEEVATDAPAPTADAAEDAQGDEPANDAPGTDPAAADAPATDTDA